MTDTKQFSCLHKGCGAKFTGTREQLATAGWFMHRGSSPRYASCPTHLPHWAPAWRAEQERKRQWKEEQAQQAERVGQSNSLLQESAHWLLKASWPTAWEPKGTVHELSQEKAFELGGGVVEGSVMTGAPLYNSPSTLTAVFATETHGREFAEWLRSFLEPRRHDDCDTRFYDLKLEYRERHDLLS